MSRTTRQQTTAPPVVKAPEAEKQVGWRLRDWLAATSVGRSTFYTLPDDITPRQVRLGKKVIITETPSAWLDRVARTCEVERIRGRKRA